jgi:NhaA family Na+:H+ antiporter
MSPSPNRTTSETPARLGQGLLTRITRPFARFQRIEAMGGALLLTAAVVALGWVNLPWHGSYERLWSTAIDIDLGVWRYDADVLHFVNDGLMSLFFLVAGLEIKRELVGGVLRDRRQVVLPVVAALGGMVVPSVTYALFNAGGDGARGWGIPMATDIAFTLAVVTALGPRVPTSVRVFLLTLAIVDDLGAIAVIVAFYGADLHPAYLLAAVAIACAIWIANRTGLMSGPLLAGAGITLWAALHHSGIHATVAGVVIGLLTPVHAASLPARRTARAVPVAERLIDVLHPWTGFVIVPLFALANAGVPVHAAAPKSMAVFGGVGLGLFAGKCAGITAFSFVAVRTGVSRLPSDVRWSQFVAAAMLAGIGFTVSLFVTALAFTERDLAESAKSGILLASIASATCGARLFVTLSRSAMRR